MEIGKTAKPDGENLLSELAQIMTGRENYPAAAALRKLAQAGYRTLEEVDAVSDWVLLATPGIGVGRLGVVRRLLRPEWQPPPSRAIKAAQRFLAAARLSLRFWPVETLEAVLGGHRPESSSVQSPEKRVSMALFIDASQKALRHGAMTEWLDTLSQLGGAGAKDLPRRRSCTQACHSGPDEPVAAATADQDLPQAQDAQFPDSNRYAYSPQERQRIVEHFRAAQKRGEIENKEAWVDSNYGISRKTLWRYEQEFPETAHESSY